MSAVINNFNGTYIEHVENYFNSAHNTPSVERVKPPCEEVQPIDTSFFCTRQFTADIIEKNIRQAVTLASSKANLCRRVMELEPLGYIVLSNVTDERKAELINPFAMPRYRLTGEDFKKARNFSHSFPGK